MVDEALDIRRYVDELERRASAWSLEAFYEGFPEPLAFVRDQSRFKVADCSRRAGKTVAIAADLVDTAIRFPDMAGLYLTLSRLNAKRIIWRDLLAINRNYGLGGKAHETELSLTFPNGHIIYLSGAKDKSEVEKFRGFPLKKVYIDEAQAFRAYLQDLVDDVLAKSLYDYNGSLALTGTPPPLPLGYFHDCVHSKKWARHSWTMLQNPHLKLKSGREPMALILEDCERMGVGIEHAKIQRECFGRWTRDTSSLVFKWNAERNDYTEPPLANSWNFVMGGDLGYDDADAICVLGWCEVGPEVYLLEEHVEAKQGITDFASKWGKITEKYSRQGQIVGAVVDAGGLGKKIIVELQTRFGLTVQAAEKTRKFEHCELLNDALTTGRFRARAASRFVQDTFLLEWDREKSNGDRLVVADTFHSDICDAVLYAYRKALGWLHVPEVKRPERGSPAWDTAELERLEQGALAQMKRREREENPTELDWGTEW